MAMETPWAEKCNYFAVIQPFIKKMDTVPITERNIKLIIHSFLFLNAPIISVKTHAPTIIMLPM